MAISKDDREDRDGLLNLGMGADGHKRDHLTQSPNIRHSVNGLRVKEAYLSLDNEARLPSPLPGASLHHNSIVPSQPTRTLPIQSPLYDQVAKHEENLSNRY